MDWREEEPIPTKNALSALSNDRYPIEHCVNFDKWLRSSNGKQWKAKRPVVNDSRLDNPEKDTSCVNRKDPFPTERVRTDGMAISTHSVPAKQLSPVTRDVS